MSYRRCSRPGCSSPVRAPRPRRRRRRPASWSWASISVSRASRSVRFRERRSCSLEASRSTWRAQSRRGSASRGSSFLHEPVFSRLYAAGPKAWDLAIAEISITAPRRANVDFSRPYLGADQGVLLAEGVAEPKSLSALRVLQLCAQRGTTSVSAVTSIVKPTRKVLLFDKQEGLLDALYRRRCDAVVNDAPLPPRCAAGSRPVRPTRRTAGRRRELRHRVREGEPPPDAGRPGSGRSAGERDALHPREALARRRHGEAAGLRENRPCSNACGSAISS